VKGGPQRSVRSFIARSSVTEKYGALLFRISRWFRPKVILELGTGLGISALYLSAGSPDAPLHTIEANSERADFSAGLFKRSRLKRVQLHVGEMEEVLESLAGEAKGRMLVFVDGNHRYGPTIRYLRWILRHAGQETVVVMDDIYWSKGMLRAWKEIISWPQVRMSIDLFQMGILLLRTDLDKAGVKIKF
jgi:predicted O-methyltransferase YrrM